MPPETRRTSQTLSDIKPLQSLAGFLNTPDESQDIKRTDIRPPNVACNSTVTSSKAIPSLLSALVKISREAT